MQVFPADVVIDADDPALHKCVAALDCIGVNVAIHILFQLVANHAMAAREMLANALVRGEFVRYNRCPRVNNFLHSLFQVGP